MNRHLAAALFVLAAAHSAHAQQTNAQEQKTAKVTVEELTAPTSPAFVLLGVTPESVDRPESPKAFVFSALSALRIGGLPTDFAMQVAPYWMKSNPTLTFEQYQNPNWRQSMKQTFAVSIGTSPILDAAATPLGTHLALGFTVRPWNGKPSASLKKTVDDDLTKAADAILDDAAARGGVVADKERFEKLLEAEIALVEKPGAADVTAHQSRIVYLQSRLAATVRRLEEMNDALEEATAEVTKAALAVQALDAKRIGFFLTISGGQVWDYLANDVGSAVAARRGVWVTPAWRRETCAADNAKCQSSLDFVFVSRLLKDPGADAMVDVGGRLAWNPNKAFSMSAELVHRNPGETVGATSQDSTNSSVRAAGILQYKLTDDLILFGTFGQDFEKATGTKPLLTLVGLNFGFGSKAAITR